MIEQDTIRLLRESDAGIKMGISSLEDSMKHIKSHKFHEIAQKSLHKHQMLQTEMQTLLADYHDDGKEPAMMAKGMEWFKTNVSLAMDACVGAVADFLVDGCNMGVKSLARYLNEYKAADEKSKDIAKKLISEEEHLSKAVRDFL